MQPTHLNKNKNKNKKKKERKVHAKVLHYILNKENYQHFLSPTIFKFLFVTKSLGEPT